MDPAGQFVPIYRLRQWVNLGAVSGPSGSPRSRHHKRDEAVGWLVQAGHLYAVDQQGCVAASVGTLLGGDKAAHVLDQQVQRLILGDSPSQQNGDGFGQGPIVAAE